MYAKEAFEHIHQVDQKVENEAVKNQCVQERDNWPGLENRLLGEDDPQSTAYPLGQTIETRIGFAARDRPIDIIDSAAAVIERAARKQHKNNFFQRGQHGCLRILRLSAYLTLPWRVCQNLRAV